MSQSFDPCPINIFFSNQWNDMVFQTNKCRILSFNFISHLLWRLQLVQFCPREIYSHKIFKAMITNFRSIHLLHLPYLWNSDHLSTIDYIWLFGVTQCNSIKLILVNLQVSYINWSWFGFCYWLWMIFGYEKSDKWN